MLWISRKSHEKNVRLLDVRVRASGGVERETTIIGDGDSSSRRRSDVERDSGEIPRPFSEESFCEFGNADAGRAAAGDSGVVRLRRRAWDLQFRNQPAER